MLRSIAALLLLVFVTNRARGQPCLIDPSDIWLVLDQSEGARVDSSDFVYLRDAVRSFVRDSRLLYPTPTAGNSAASLIRVGLVAYSSVSAISIPLTSPGNLDAQLSSAIPAPGVPSASSITSLGLQQILNTVESRSVNRYVILISNSGSFSSAETSRAVSAANQLRNRGYTLFVYGVSPQKGNLYETELQQLGGALYQYVSSYSTALPQVLNAFITNFLCISADTSPCTECSLGRGTYLFQAPISCQQFIQCLPNKAYIMQDCAAGTLFNKVTGRCELDQNYDCDAWGGSCGVNQQETFKAKCCTQYFQCRNKTVTLNNCPATQVYRDNTQRCTIKTSADQNCDLSPACHPTTNVIMNEATCRAALFDVEPGNRCKFRHYRTDQRQLYEVVDCAEGSAWSQANCTCIPDITCVQGLLTSRGQARGVSEVASSALVAWVDVKGTMSANSLTLDGTPGRLASIAYMPYFNMQTFPGNFALVIRFAITQSTLGREYDILVNDFCGECNPSIYIRAQLTSPSTVQASLRLRSQSNQLVNIQSSVNINFVSNGQTPLLKVAAIFLRSTTTNLVSVTFRVDTSDANGISLTRGTTGSGQISDIAAVPCGLAIGKGAGNPLVGTVDDFQYIKCDDPRVIIS